jgi:hypothetical protein
VEWSFDVEAEFFVELTFTGFTLPLISVNNIELLIDSSVLVEDLNVLVLDISISGDIHDLTFLVSDEGTVNISEELPPS